MSVEENKRVVTAYLAAMGGGAPAADLLAADARWWLPRIGPVPFSELAAIAGAVSAKLKTGVSMTIDHVTAEGDRVSVEAHGESKLIDGQNYNNVYHFLFFLRDGRIVEIHEHGDSAYAHRVLGFNPSEHLEPR